jgi:hypothetical protein
MFTSVARAWRGRVERAARLAAIRERRAGDMVGGSPKKVGGIED